MRLPTTLLHHHQILSRRVPAVPFPFPLPTSVQRQTLSARLLQFRPSSSSASNDVEFQKNVHRLIAAQRAFDRAQTKGVPSMREMVKRARTLTVEENRVMMDQYFDAETERWTIVSNLLKEEVTRVDPSDRLKVQMLVGSKKTTKFAQLILERAAEPSHGLTPDDLKMVKKAVSHVASTSEKGVTYMKVGGFALGAGILYYIYNVLNWSP